MTPVALARAAEMPAFAEERARVLAPAPVGPRRARREEVTPLLPTIPSALQRRRDDAWLAARVGRHLPDSFDVLFERHWAHLRSYCVGILGSADEAQDAAQEAMTRAYRRLWRTKDVPPFKPLLFAIARNTCIDRLRERSRTAGPVEEHHLPAVAGADEVATGRGGVDLLVADLRALSERQRTALVLRTACDLSHDEIAATLETTPAKVKSLISEARRALEQRRAGHELSCEEYRSGVERVRGPVRNQSLLAHRATCACCGERPMPHFVLGLPALAVAWMLRRARDLAGTTTVPTAGPVAAKLAVAIACIGTAAIPAGQALDRGGETRPAALVASAASAPAPDAREGTSAGPRRAEPRAAQAPSTPGGAKASRREERSRTARAAAAGGAPGAATAPHVDRSGSAMTVVDRVRESVDHVQKITRARPERVAATAPTVRRVTSEALRDVERGSARVAAAVDGAPAHGERDVAALAKALGGASR